MIWESKLITNNLNFNNQDKINSRKYILSLLELTSICPHVKHMATKWGSEYFLTLETEKQQLYKKKLTLSNGTSLADPSGIRTEFWEQDVSLLPDIDWPDIYNYLIDTPSEYTKDNLKAYKSLEAYNFFISGHVHDIYCYKNKETDYCYLKTEVSVKCKIDTTQ